MPYTADLIVTLYVDTARITSIVNPTPDQVKDCIYFADNQLDVDPADKSNFTSMLSGNSQLSWVGAVLNMTPNLEDYVLINDVTFKANQNNIGIQLRPKPNGSGNTHIDGYIPGNGNKNSGTESFYTLSFSVCRGSQFYDYSIDPQLKMR